MENKKKIEELEELQWERRGDKNKIGKELPKQFNIFYFDGGKVRMSAATYQKVRELLIQNIEKELRGIHEEIMNLK